jgi:hypothetical protein
MRVSIKCFIQVHDCTLQMDDSSFAWNNDEDEEGPSKRSAFDRMFSEVGSPILASYLVTFAHKSTEIKLYGQHISRSILYEYVVSNTFDVSLFFMGIPC